MKNLTELVIIIDRSGSMHGLEQDVVGGFNSLIKEQKKEGDTTVTTLFFNDFTEFVHTSVDIKKIEPLKNEDYRPRGRTALLDAIGDAVNFVKAKHAKLKDKDLPKNTIISIMTDGLENASRYYSYERIKDIIEFQKKCGWTFIFQAANIDTEYEAGRLGVDLDMAMSFKADSEGVSKQMKYCSLKISDIKKNKRN